ncbi:rhomboid family intramembrane serine protease [Trinickia terrae]|uniref:Rhomboid family intramembrane serine protease n=1 Tax=Trinickia terrae TaxID=2571161 RepID=A0A4U1I002_9BURK|nr:rhomboid family intramembrane serine protease [Trinickia terrae]TKC86266.1 rhomboid family intramembrane serine protease [Trinickia terrae]
MILALVALNVAAFLLEQAYPQTLIDLFALWPPAPAGVPAFHPAFHVWQLVTYSALHANLTHLAVDVIGLHLFGRDLELALGWLRLAALYLASVAAGGRVPALLVQQAGPPAIGGARSCA